MIYPTISEYIDAIKAAEDNFEELKNLRPVLDEEGRPVMTSGNFAVVFKMKDLETGKYYALKCFTKEQKGRGEAYRLITEELKDVDSPYLTSIRYLDKELFVDTNQSAETEFPVLLMDWVEGKTLDKYLRENLDDKYALEMLAYRFSQLAQWLIPQPFAHGDLKPDNILVREDGSLVLVDYDGMYVPAMKGQKARELGSPDFRHPLRTETDFDEHIDGFPLALILLSLNAISINPLLLIEYGDSNRLLLSEKDYRDIIESPIIHRLMYFLSIYEFAQSFSLFIYSLTHFKPSIETISTFINLHQSPPFPEMYYYTNVLEKDREDCLEYDMGIRYSKDGKRLIWCGGLYPTSVIRQGTEVICDNAFSGEYHEYDSIWNNIGRIVIPRSVMFIGRNPFAFCYVQIICNSSFFVIEDNALYTSDKQLLIGYYGYNEDRFIVPKGVRRIGDYAFAGLSLKYIKLPSTVEAIGDFAFQGCQILESIELSDKLKHIGRQAFRDCYKLNKMELPSGLISIGSLAFHRCSSIKSIIIPSTVISIGINPFLYNKMTIHSNAYLFEVENNTLYSKNKKTIISCLSQEKSFQIPKEVTHIGQHAFYGCPFKELYIHDGIMHIEEDAFDGCYYGTYNEYGGYGYIMEILVPKGRYDWFRTRITKRISIKEIDSIPPFNVCRSTTEDLWTDVSNLEMKNAWTDEYGVTYSANKERLLRAPLELKRYSIKQGTKVICSHAFSKCFALEYINIPDSVTEIGEWAFAECSFKTLTIPNNVLKIGNYAFWLCLNLKTIYMLPQSVEFGNGVFEECENVTSVYIPIGTINIYSHIIPEYKDIIRVH